jgi:hypothetical protein
LSRNAPAAHLPVALRQKLGAGSAPAAAAHAGGAEK